MVQLKKNKTKTRLESNIDKGENIIFLSTVIPVPFFPRMITAKLNFFCVKFGLFCHGSVARIAIDLISSS